MSLEMYREELNRALALQKQGDLAAANERIAMLLEQFPLQADLLIKKYQLQRLLKGVDVLEGKTSDAELRLANELVPTWAIPFIELGFWEYSVKDRSNEAFVYFEKARRLAKSQLIQAYAGEIKCLIDLGKVEEAKTLYASLTDAFPEDSNSEVYDIKLDNPTI